MMRTDLIYNILGKPVKTLIKEYQAPGYYSIVWNADGYSSSIYFVKLRTGEQVRYHRLMLIK